MHSILCPGTPVRLWKSASSPASWQISGWSTWRVRKRGSVVSHKTHLDPYPTTLVHACMFRYLSRRVQLQRPVYLLNRYVSSVSGAVSLLNLLDWLWVSSPPVNTPKLTTRQGDHTAPQRRAMMCQARQARQAQRSVEARAKCLS